MNSNKIKLSALNPELKSKLLDGKLLISAAVGSLGAFAFISAKDIEKVNIESNNSESLIKEESGNIEFCSHANFGQADDQLSFAEAFKMQRELLGTGGIFEYKNKYYNTFFKEEWDSMQSSEKDDYYSSIDKFIDYSEISHFDPQMDQMVKLNLSVSLDENGNIEIQSESPNVFIESFTINFDIGKLKHDVGVPTPEESHYQFVDSFNSDEDGVSLTINDFLIDNKKDTEKIIDESQNFENKSSNEIHFNSEINIQEEDDNILDPSFVHIEDSNTTEPSLIIEDDNVLDPSFIEVEDDYIQVSNNNSEISDLSDIHLNQQNIAENLSSERIDDSIIDNDIIQYDNNDHYTNDDLSITISPDDFDF